MNPSWRNKKTWNGAGLILTAAWFTYLAMASRGDASHPAVDFIFLAPLGLWLVIVVATRLLGVGEPERGPDG